MNLIVMPVQDQVSDSIYGYCICDDLFKDIFTIPTSEMEMLFESEAQARQFLKDFINES